MQYHPQQSCVDERFVGSDQPPGVCTTLDVTRDFLLQDLTRRAQCSTERVLCTLQKPCVYHRCAQHPPRCVHNIRLDATTRARMRRRDTPLCTAGVDEKSTKLLEALAQLQEARGEPQHALDIYMKLKRADQVPYLNNLAKLTT